MENFNLKQTGVQVQELLDVIPDKADKATTLEGYGITDAYTKAEDDALLETKADKSDTYTKDQTDGLLDTKADNGTTLADYGITDAYTKDEVDDLLDEKADKATTLAGYGIGDAYTKQEVNNLITTPDQQYVTVEATDQTTAATDVLPATGEPDTIYRVGNWDGTQYDPTNYSEYAWDGTQYVLLDTKDFTLATASDFDNPTAAQQAKIPTVGAILGCMDTTPTKGSQKPVQSNGVRQAIDASSPLIKMVLTDSSFVYSEFHDVIQGHTYRVWIKNPNISITTITYGYYFYIYYTHLVNGVETEDYFVRVANSQLLDNYYDFNIPDAIKIRIALRADTGQVQWFYIEDLESFNNPAGKVRECLNVVNFIHGTINAEGNDTKDSIRLKSAEYLRAPFSIKSLDSNYEYRIATYTLNGVFESLSNYWHIEQNDITDNTHLYRITMRKSDNSDLAITDSKKMEILSSPFDHIQKIIPDITEIENDVNIIDGRVDVLEADKVQYISITSANIHNNATPAAATDPEPTDGRDWDGHNLSPITGAIGLSSNYAITYYIPVVAGGSYKCTANIRRLVWYNSSKTVLSILEGTIEAGTEIVVPSDAAYCRFMYATSTGSAGPRYTPDEVRFGKYNEDVDVPYGTEVTLEDKYGRKILTEEDYDEIEEQIKEVKTVTAVGSSGLALGSGGQYQLTAEQKTAYGVTSDLVMAKVVQVLLEYDETNICANGGNTASNEMFKCSLTSYILKNSVTLPANGSTVSYAWNTTNIGAAMTENLSSINPDMIGSFDGIVNGVNVIVNAVAGTICLAASRSTDFVIIANSILTRAPLTSALNNNGVLRKPVAGSYGLILQIGANSEGATPEEILSYNELVVQESGCKWFICLPKNATGINSDPTNDLNAAIPLLRKKFGSRFIDHRPYMCSLEALSDQGITPTTSAEYPDINGQNSNPLTPTQIANGVKCDMQCIAEGLYPSSFWHSAYREGEVQEINATHFNAQGLECLGKFIVKMLKQFGI